ncbi:hypothetical protein [Rhodoferax antarcticus]|uniref:Uncharacterized protein n=1 Tax=Rhodoferax antarcticus ANT.BR TaxID=1111071 RepID=A0A1Q8Y931_9BURK|nr:hypothetical protein [Rhodoferax antarcticus]OLP04525.1 hypothetical protein BLL52_4285 [Rhodoferax antarcticus ANT.BR]
MPRFKTETFHVENTAGTRVSLSVVININAQGQFYALLPGLYRDSFSSLDSYKIGHTPTKGDGGFRVVADIFEALRADIQQGLQLHLTPVICEVPVVRYNIESHVSFATDDEGNIFPNAGFSGASWDEGANRSMYGSHHATNQVRGGYSITVGARAMLKRIITHGENVRVEYENFYDGGSHLKSDNPANLLNSWIAMDLGKNPKELPYTPKTALFFHNLLLGMARLNQQIQAATFEQEALLQLIEKQASVPLLQMPAAPRLG